MRPINDNFSSFRKIHRDVIVYVGLHLADAPIGLIGVLHALTGL